MQTKLKSKIISDCIFDLMDALKSPILTYSQAWADTIPERLLKIIPIARIINLMTKEETATNPEVLAFIYTRTLEAPMSSEWVSIYSHLTCKVCEQYWKEDRWSATETLKELSEYDTNYYLKPLRRFIYEKRRKILKERMKQEAKIIVPVCIAKEQIKIPDLIEGHYSLWNS